MPIGVSLVLVVVFLAMNAFFVIAEFAMVRVRPSQIEMAVAEGKPGAVAAKRVTGDVNAYLSACQLGITLASLALGWLGEPAFSALVRPVLVPLGMPDAAISAVAIAFGYILMTTLHVVAGELIPKSFAIFATEAWALRTARPLVWFYRLTFPVMWLFNTLTSGVVKLTGHDPDNEREVYTDEEIKLLIDESTESGLIDPAANEYVDNIFDIGDKDAEAIMTPRIDLVCLDLEDTLEENLAAVRNYKYTRYPVCRGSKDRIVGFVHVKDLYTAREAGVADVGDLRIRPIMAVPEGLSVAKLLTRLQAEHTKIAVVVDEHGGTSGIVTMSDVMEQIVGRVDDEYSHGEDDAAVEIAPGDFLIDGSMPIDEVVELLGFSPAEAAECETAGGLLLALFDRIPDEGDEVDAFGEAAGEIGKPAGEGAGGDAEAPRAHFTVVEMDNLRVEKIRVTVGRDHARY